MSTITLTATQQATLAHAIHHTEGRIEWFPESIKGGARQKVLTGLFNRALITSNGVDHFVAAEGYDVLGYPRPGICSIAPNLELEAEVAQAEATWAHAVETNASVPADEGASDDLAIKSESQACQRHSATGCHGHQGDTDAPATEIGATQCHSLPDMAPSAAPVEQTPIKVVRTREHSKQATIIGMLQRAEGATVAQICEATGWQAHTVRGTFAGAFKKKLGMTITSVKAQGGERTYRAAA